MKMSMMPDGGCTITAPVASWLDPSGKRTQVLRLTQNQTRDLAGEILRLLKEDLIDEPLS